MDKSVTVFIDDILVYSWSTKEHQKHLREVLDMLRKDKIYEKFPKCEFWLKEVYLLGHIVGPEGIKVGPTKIVAVMESPKPKTPTDI